MRDTTLLKINKWLQIFKDKNESGLSSREYMKEHGITRDQYYYWLRRCRAYYKESEQGKVVFAELKPPLPLDNTYVKQDMSLIDNSGSATLSGKNMFTYPPDYFDAQIRLSINKITVDIREGTSLQLIKDTVEVLNNVKGFI